MTLVAVAGPGAVGSWLALELRRGGHSVRVIPRGGSRPVDLGIVRGDGTTDFGRFPVITADEQGTIDAIFFTTKAHDLSEAASRVAPLQRPGSVMVSLANGMVLPVWQEMARRWPHLVWRIGSSVVGLAPVSGKPAGWWALSPGSPSLTFGAWTDSGMDRGLPSRRETPSLIEQEIIGSVPVLSWRTDSVAAHWRKWLVNTCANSIAGVYGLGRNQLVLEHPLLRTAFDEAFALGCEIAGGTDAQGPFGCTQETAFELLLATLRATSSGENSMARDVRLRRRTESAFLAGLAVGRAGYPVLKMLHANLAVSDLVALQNREKS